MTTQSSAPSATSAAAARAPSFHRKPLPDSAIAFSSLEGIQLFREAVDRGTMG